MSGPSPKDLRIAFLTQKRRRMIRLTQHLFGGFRNAISYTDEIEIEIQYFLDGHRHVDNLLGLPSFPFLNEMWDYCFLRSFAIPEISTPFSVDFPKIESAEEVNYNNIFLAVPITFTALHSFERRPPRRI